MIRGIALLLSLSSLSFSVAASAAEETAPKDTAASTIEEVIPPSIRSLDAPVAGTFTGGLKMAVTAIDGETQAHVVAGLNHLHGGWEFEAMRHFLAAARRDPQCLMAHWGLAMSLLAPNPETDGLRDAAVEQVLDLAEAGVGNDLEQGYAYALVQYRKEGAALAAETFRKLSEKFPNDIQAILFRAIFGRGGYNDFGLATPDQEASEKLLEEALAKHPDSTLILNALLTIRAEAPDLTPSLPLAKKLTELAPDYPPYFHLLGHYQWRAGQHAKAALAFSRASILFDNWMSSSGVGIVDCPGWVASECYRAVALASKGDFDTAFEVAEAVAAIPVPSERSASPGGRMLLWEGKTLPARLLLERGATKDATKALATLPKADVLKAYDQGSLARWWIDGLRLSLEANRLMKEKDTSAARETSNALSHHGERFSQLRSLAFAGGEGTYWNRAFRSLEALASELRGQLAMAGPKAGQGAAYNWFQAAKDRQTRSTMMLPPPILTPMSFRLAEYYISTGELPEAIEAYREALRAFPNHRPSLEGLAKALEKSGDSAGAQAVREQGAQASK